MKRQLSPLWQIFPSPRVLGFYSPIGQYIQLNEIEEKELKQILEEPTKAPINDKSLIQHELRHWADHNLTLWGLKNNVLIFNAYSSRLSLDENRFFRVKQLSDAFKKDSLLTYYTEHYNNVTGSLTNPWRYQLSVGIRYDYEGRLNHNRPIIFVKFDAIDKTPVCRVPLSVTSLLETKAIHEEFIIKSKSISNITDIVEFHLQKDRLKIELESWLYNPDFVLYSVAAHLTAGTLRITDVIKAFEISFHIASIALNLPQKLVKLLPIPTQLSAWGERSNKLLENNDEGFIFFLLLENYKNNYSGNFDLNEVLSSSNLPTLDELVAESIEESYQHLSNVEAGIFTSYAWDKIGFYQHTIPQVGISFILDDLHQISWMNRHLPPFICNDTNFELIEFENFEPLMDKAIHGQRLTFQEFFSIFCWCEFKFEEFSQICGI